MWGHSVTTGPCLSLRRLPGTHLSVLVGRVTEISPRMRCRISVGGLGSEDVISPSPARMTRVGSLEGERTPVCLV